MYKIIFLFVFSMIYCQSNSSDKELINKWFNSIKRDQVITDDEYNVIKTESAIDTTFINIRNKTITIRFILRHNKDSTKKNDESIHLYYTRDTLNNYDTTVYLPYVKNDKTLIINIKDNKYRVGYYIGNGCIIFQEIDKIPIFIKNTDRTFNKEYFKIK
jgi:hypothetical protein